MSLNLTGDYEGQNLIPDSKKTAASPDSRSETPEIHVIIKEEEEGWTVSENSEWMSFTPPRSSQGLCRVLLDPDLFFSFSFIFSSNTDESFGSGEREDTRGRHPLAAADGKESADLYYGKGNERVCLEESDGSSSREGEPRRRLVDSDETSLRPGIVTTHRRIKKAKSSSRKRKVMRSLQQSHVAEELLANDGRLSLQQSTSSQAEHWEAAGSSSCQTVSEHIIWRE